MPQKKSGAPRQSPTRILQIVENLNNQAVETWISRVFSLSRKTHHDYEWTFFCVLGQAGRFDEAMREKGATVIHSPHDMGNKRAFISSLRATMKQNQYDILHCQQDIMSAVPLLASVGLPFRKKIVHVHNTSIGLPTANAFKQTLVREPFRHTCLRAADHIVGVSEVALDAMLGGHRRREGRDLVIHCGIDTKPLHEDWQGASELRATLGYDANTKILLFVGRMTQYKNPIFVVEILECLLRVSPHYAAVFVGVGPQEERVRELAGQKNLLGNIRVLGWRDDVAHLMQTCDILIWPGVEEPKEGLGLGVVEAQACALPILMSLNVPEEAAVIPELVNTLPLAAGAQVWADAVLKILSGRRPHKQQTLRQIEASSFAIERSAANIVALYER